MGVTGIMDIVMNAMYPNDYRFRDIYLLTTATPGRREHASKDISFAAA